MKTTILTTLMLLTLISCRFQRTTQMTPEGKVVTGFITGTQVMVETEAPYKLFYVINISDGSAPYGYSDYCTCRKEVFREVTDALERYKTVGVRVRVDRREACEDLTFWPVQRDSTVLREATSQRK